MTSSVAYTRLLLLRHIEDSTICAKSSRSSYSPSVTIIDLVALDISSERKLFCSVDVLSQIMFLSRLPINALALVLFRPYWKNWILVFVVMRYAHSLLMSLYSSDCVASIALSFRWSSAFQDRRNGRGVLLGEVDVGVGLGDNELLALLG